MTAFVLDGSWHYLERDCVATKGRLIYEPAGDIHTLVTGGEGTIILFQMEAALIYVDQDDKVVGQDDVMSFTKLYDGYCMDQGVERLNLRYSQGLHAPDATGAGGAGALKALMSGEGLISEAEPVSIEQDAAA